MNAAQILRLGLFMADAVNADSTTDPLFTQPELLTWATDATWKAEAELRRAKEDFGLLVLQSNDAAYRWAGTTYSPASLQLTTSTVRAALPPDLLTLKAIRCITSGYETMKFREVDMSSAEFKYGQAFAVGGGTRDDEILYDVVGDNTLALAWPTASTVDIEISYISRSAPLQIYSTGTVTLVNANTAVSGASTAWVADEVRNPVELIVSTDATAPKIVSQTSGGVWVDPSVRHSPVQSIDSDGALTLAGSWLLTGVAGKGYLLATVPNIPPEHHMQIVDALAARIKLKAENRGSDAYFKLEGQGGKRMTSDVTERQLDTPRVVQDYIAG